MVLRFWIPRYKLGIPQLGGFPRAQWFGIRFLCLDVAPGLDYGLMTGAEELGQVVRRLSMRRRQLLDDLVHVVGRNTHGGVPFSLSFGIDQDGILAIKPVLASLSKEPLMRLRPKVPEADAC